MNKPQDLRQLVELALERHGTSIRQLGFKAQDRGFRLAGTTLGHIRAGTYKYVPTGETIRAIAWLAGVSDEVAFTAAGQPVPGPPFADELPHGVDNLSPRAKKAAIDMLRVLVEAEAGNSENKDKSKKDPSSPRTLRAVGSSRQVIAGQKIDPEDPDFETVPPLEQLAAHPYQKLHREKFDDAYGGVGEENQDPDSE